ncbi:MAG: hypothetical protein P1P88_15035 [Bacteroidales bacterium]|nr:hypothetical protein [Bacteroidales bacterium]
MEYREIKRKLSYIFSLTICLSIFSCLSNQEVKETPIIYLRSTIYDLSKAGITNIGVEDNKYYHIKNIFYDQNLDYLISKKLDNTEIEKLNEFLERLDYSEFKQQFISNPYGANYSYNIYITYKQKELEIDIFDDSIPKTYKPLIDFLEAQALDSNFDTIYSRVEGVNYSRIVLPEEDTSDYSYKELFCMWKYLMLYDNVIEETNLIDTTKEYTNYSLMYGLDYQEKKIKNMKVGAQSIYLTYENDEIIKLKKDPCSR